MSRMIFVYLIVPIGLFILFLLSRDKELPSGMEESGISRAYLKMSLFVYEKVKGRVKSFSAEKIRMYLATLKQKKDLEEAEAEYFIRKISIVLMMATAGCFLSIMMCLSIGSKSYIDENGTAKRNAFGEREYDIDLVAKNESGEEVFSGSFPVRTREFTKEEADQLFFEASDELEEIVLKNNASFDEVKSDIDLVEKVPGYPFVISWKMDNYDVVHFDGKLIEENIPKEGAIVNLTAVFSYREMKWQKEMSARILPRDYSPAERAYLEVKELLNKADEDSITKEEIRLPDEYWGQKMIWSERKTDNSMLLLALTLIGGAASYVMKDKELKKAMEERSSQMLLDYPQFVSQLVLYMGAGMTVRNIFSRLTDNYIRARKAGAQKRYLYEELIRTTRELSIGRSEAEAYESFGLRCGGQQYTRLGTLLSQNLRKGNNELLRLLQEESKKAFEGRMDKARKLGEEAGTKLLLPMIIMLVIVMVIIMIPAYLAF